MSKIEQTLSIIKPDAVERNLDNEIKQIFIENNFIPAIFTSNCVSENDFQNALKFMKIGLLACQVFEHVFLLDSVCFGSDFLRLQT